MAGDIASEVRLASVNADVVPEAEKDYQWPPVDPNMNYGNSYADHVAPDSREEKARKLQRISDSSYTLLDDQERDK